MKALKTILLAGAMVGGLAGAAAAADFVPVPDQYASAADSGWYLRGDVGWAFLDWNGGSNDDDVTFGGGVGYRYNSNLRADIRVDYAGDYDIGGGADLGFGTALVNGYYDFPISSQIAPYLGVGAGYGWTVRSPGPDRDGFAYALMAGVSFDMTQQIALDVGYRFRQVLVSGPDVSDHSALAGVRFEF
jgi:opacity protein-like surface antigen